MYLLSKNATSCLLLGSKVDSSEGIRTRLSCRKREAQRASNKRFKRYYLTIRLRARDFYEMIVARDFYEVIVARDFYEVIVAKPESTITS